MTKMPKSRRSVRVWKEKLRLSNCLLRNLLCEFMATIFLIYVGLCVDAQMVLSRQRLNLHLAHSLGWGMALVFAVQMAFPVTGAHLNPAVSFSAWSFGELSFSHFALYSLAQTAGAFLGAALTYLLYFEKIAEFDGGIRAVCGPLATAVVFATYPGEHLSVLGSVIDQTSCTAVLCFIIGIITDQRNGIPRLVQPAMMGLMLALICMGFGLNAGNAMNPARDLGPRLFTYLVGYGWEVFRIFCYNNYGWFWVPVICPFLGALIGSWTYQLFVSSQLPREMEETEGANSTKTSMNSTTPTLDTVIK